MRSGLRLRLAFLGLLLGATGIGFAPILVRLSEVGPSATAFYRLFLSLPVLWVWMRLESRDPVTNPAAASLESAANPPGKRTRANQAAQLRSHAGTLALAGFFFAADLAFWHWSIRWTTVANSTLITNFAPILVTLGARFIFLERITVALLVGLALAILGGILLVGASLQITRDYVVGDFLALVTAFFYAAYLLTVKYLRRRFSTPTILLFSGLVSSPLLLGAAMLSREPLLAGTVRGWFVLLMLAWVSQVGGQGLITYGMAHLTASFTAVSLLLQPVVAAVLAWLILDEQLTWLHAMGGAVILTGIAVASRGNAGANAGSRPD